MLSRVDHEHMAVQAARLVGERMKELGITQGELARRAHINVTAFRSRLLYRTGKAPDVQMLGSVSLACEWDARYLPGLMSGKYTTEDDPQNLPDDEPATKGPKWQPPPNGTPAQREAVLERKVKVQGVKIKLLEGNLDVMGERVARLEAALAGMTTVSRQRAV